MVQRLAHGSEVDSMGRRGPMAWVPGGASPGSPGASTRAARGHLFTGCVSTVRLGTRAGGAYTVPCTPHLVYLFVYLESGAHGSARSSSMSVTRGAWTEAATRENR